jgi:Spy/CpxP family protein refolding chaperone
MKKYVLGIFVVLTLTFFTGQAFCQSEDSDKPPSKEQVEKIRKKVQTLKLWKLTEALDLDEETAAKLFPVMNKYEKKRFAIEQSIKKDMKKLRKIVDTASPDELAELIRRLEENHRELQALNGEQFQEFKAILPVRKVAKFLIFQQDFSREMRKIIREAKQKKGKNKDKAPFSD